MVKPVEMQAPPPESIWYLPHHPVTNPNKPGKVRRVANAASKFRGESLNLNLLTGPDLLNNLVGVLLRTPGCCFVRHRRNVYADCRETRRPVCSSFPLDDRQLHSTIPIH